LKDLRDGQPPEVRQRIDQILASFDPKAEPVTPVRPPAAEPAQFPINGEAPLERG
jgi:hypothetical protein